MRRTLFTHPIVVTIAVIILAVLLAFAIIDFSHPVDPKDGETVTVQVDKDSVKAKVAAAPQSQETGLAGTPPLTDQEGMLFVFDQPAIQTFWMKGMTYPIDIIWIEDETVSEVSANVAPVAAGTPDAAIPKISSPYPVNRVLEVPAGWAAKHNIQPGDPLKIK
jgi:uncharacterized membrane protein (UPF0127 family)